MHSCKNKNTRVVWMFRLLFLVVGHGTLISCAPFSKNLDNPSKLNSENISLLNGTYTVNNRGDSIQRSNGEWFVYHRNFLKEIDRKLIKDTLKFDTVGNNAFKLKMKNPNLLQVEYIKDSIVYRRRSLKAKITKDGFVKLKNKNLQLLLIPYILGGIGVKRIRLTVDSDGDLIFNTSEHRSRAALFMFFGGRNYQYTYRFENISDTIKKVVQ